MAGSLKPGTPSDEQLVAAVRTLRTENPTLGIVKFHALLLMTHTEWSVSEKRFRKVLQQHGLHSIRAAQDHEDVTTGGTPEKVYPTFRTMDRLDIGQWTKKVEIKYFGKKKGKGLVAKERIEKGETVWKEDPWIIAPEWDIFNAQEASLACGYCTTPLSNSRIVVACPALSGCPARFCNRLCFSKSAITHPLLCRAQNPAVVPLLDFAKRGQWIGLHALAHQTARLLLANEKGVEEREAQWSIIRGFAEMGMEDRVKEDGQSTTSRDRAAWNSAYRLYKQAFRNPTDVASQKKLARLIKQPLPVDIESQFTYEGFLRGLGRMNLNLEAHGGLYVLHSHLNHACNPNLSVRHFDQRSALARITLVALNDIEPGKELLITYVDPNASVHQRRRQLREWGFAECSCTRCVKEAADLSAEEADPISVEVKVTEKSRVDMTDLEDELREGFGL